MTMSTSSSKVHIVNFSSYTTPVVKEVQGKDYVEYGDNNDYFGYLIDRYNGSPTNNAILNSLMDLTYGKGLDATDSAKKPSEYAAMRGLFTKSCLQKVVADYVMMGQCSFQVVYSQDHNTIVEVQHIPVETLRAARCNEEGEVEAYYYAKDWEAVSSRKETAVRIPAFGKSKEGLEILYIKPYRAGFYYYSPVDYQGGLPYAELEEEIANYHINNIQNGLAPSMLINFNNGVPSEEERRSIEQQIATKFSGSSNSGKFILAFNDNKDLAATVDPVQLSDAAEQYQFLSAEATQKLMVSHRIVSPMLLGIKDNSGFGNNADELMTASTLLDNIVIRPKQEIILDGLDMILAYNDISLNLYFKTLQPLEFTETEVQDAEVVEEATGVKTDSIEPMQVSEANEELIQKEASYNGAQIASSLQIMQSVKDGVLTVDQAITFLVQMLQFDPQVANALFKGNSSAIISQMKSHKFKSEVPEFSKDDEHKWIDALRGKGEVVDLEEWELISDEVVNDPDNEDTHLATQYNFAVEDFSNSESKSSFDSGLYKIRYAYTRNISSNSREFCREMVGAANGGTVFRKEDIDMMSFSGENGQFAPQGQSVYSIWKWKGGAFCHHAWRRLVYFRKKQGGKFLPNEGLDNDKLVSTEQAIKEGVPTSKLVPNGWDAAQTRPIDTSSRGSLKYR
jgi:hypothetical protein